MTKSRKGHIPQICPVSYVAQQMQEHLAEGLKPFFAYRRALSDLKSENRRKNHLPPHHGQRAFRSPQIDWEDFWERLADWLLDRDPESARFLFLLVKAFRVHETSARCLLKYPEFLAVPEEPFRGLWISFDGAFGSHNPNRLGKRLQTLREQIIQFGHDARPRAVGNVA